ncbi:uncharacterized protein NKAPD1 [Neosynchiropus ocellatus]
MAKNPLGKTLLRNVIRHTDAHNKIQEETEMWKMRGYEVQMSQNKHFPATESTRGGMHCDRDQSEFLSRSRERTEHDDRDARYWTRKLYEFEDKDPDRWGHSGFKELYPEDFESESEHSGTTKKSRSKKSKSAKETSNSKKSSRKKKKKKKKHDEGRRKKTACSSSDSSSDDSSDAKDKKKRTKNQHKKKKSARKKEDSSSGDSDDDKERDRWKHSRKRRKQDSNKDSSPDFRKKRRKNWEAAGEDGSDACRD